MHADLDVAHFHTFGFVVLRQVFDPTHLSDEVDRAFRYGFRVVPAHTSDGEHHVRYVPTMSERTPVSLSLLDRFAEPAALLLGAPVLPVRAKAVQYRGNAVWPRDSEWQIATVGFASYLEPLTAIAGALRVLPGSPPRARRRGRRRAHQAARAQEARY